MTLLIKARLNRLTALEALERRRNNIFVDEPRRSRPTAVFVTRRAA